MRKNQKRVLVALGWYDQRLHRGIEKYAQEHSWHLSADVTKEKVIPWGWTGDGILAWLGIGDDLAEFVVRSKKPTVDFSFRRPHLGFPHVLEDHACSAQIVAEHFLSRGFVHFMFYSDMENWAYDERGQGFADALKRRGYVCNWLRWHKSPAYYPGGRTEEWKRKRKWLTAQLKQSPKPLAVFAATDALALDVLETCEDAGLVVPEQVAIVGADNSLLAVDAMHTPISSVEINMEAVGYRGAALLDEMMNGKAPPQEPVRIPPVGLIVRKSSDLLAVNHKGVAKSLRFIWEHFHEPISVKDLMAVAAMSRRALYSSFLQHIGRTPGEEIHRVRIDHAKKLLAEPGQKIENVASVCGYQSSNSFWVTFKKTTGMSPKKYRQATLH